MQCSEGCLVRANREVERLTRKLGSQPIKNMREGRDFFHMHAVVMNFQECLRVGTMQLYRRVNLRKRRRLLQPSFEWRPSIPVYCLAVKEGVLDVGFDVFS